MVFPNTVCASEVVRVIDAFEMDWREGRRSIELELRTSGYQLEQERSDAVEPGLLLEQLQHSDPNLAGRTLAASVTVVRMGTGGIAYVWIPDAAQMYRVTSSELDPEQAANVMSLRVAELISLRGVGFEVDQSAPRKVTAEKQQSSADSIQVPVQKTVPQWAVLAGGGPSFSSRLSRPMANLYIGIQRTLIPAVSLELSGEFSVAFASQHFEQGIVEVAQQGVRLGALFQIPLFGQGSALGQDSTFGRLNAQIGPMFGYRCFDLRTQSAETMQEQQGGACSFIAGGLTRVGFHWNAFSLWFAGILDVGLAPIRLLDGEDVIATLGRPSGLLLGGVGWEF